MNGLMKEQSAGEVHTEAEKFEAADLGSRAVQLDQQLPYLLVDHKLDASCVFDSGT